MTKEQLIHAMSLLNFTETTDYTIDQDYESIVMLNELLKPTQEELDSAIVTEVAAIEATRISDINQRLSILPEIVILIGLYIEQNKVLLDDSDSFNIAGFSDCGRLESSFGWSFKNLPKPTINQLEALIPTKEANDTIEIWNVMRKERDQLLKDSDFTQLSDSPLTELQKSDWAIYRQTLRDLPFNIIDPSNPIWPTKPQ